MRLLARSARRWLESAGALLLVAACSSQADHGRASETAQAFCQDWLTAIGSHAQTCTGASQAVIDVALSELHPCSDVSASLASQHLVYDESYGTACLSEVEALPCWQSLTAASSCAKAFAGTVPSGGACLPLASALISECQPNSRCAASNACPGTCVATDLASVVPAGQIGDACSLVQQCADALVCEDDGGPVDSLSSLPDATGTCQPPPATGPCDFNDQCAGKCAGTNDGATIGSCVPWKALGEACAPGAKECAVGSYCGSQGTCQLLAAVGQSCSGNAGEGMDCLDGYCDPQSLQCVSFLEAGATCVIDGQGFFPADPCGGFRASCTQSTCVVSCFSSQ